jgi:hypothetical protein
MADVRHLDFVRTAGDEWVDRDGDRWDVDYLWDLCPEPVRDCRLWASGEEVFADAAKWLKRQDAQRQVVWRCGWAVNRVRRVVADVRLAEVRRDRYDE